MVKPVVYCYYRRSEHVVHIVRGIYAELRLCAERNPSPHGTPLTTECLFTEILGAGLVCQMFDWCRCSLHASV